MNTLDRIRRLHQHRAWVNGNLIAAAEHLTGDQLRAPFPIGQGSIWKSLLHLYAAEFVWLEALLGDDASLAPGDLPGKIPGNQEGQGGVTHLADLRQKWSALEERWTDYLSSLTPDALDDPVYKKRYSGERSATRRSDHYTAAQVVNMLRQLGVEKLPEMMVISLARSEGK